MSTSPSALALSAKWLQQGVVARHETFCPRYGWLKKSVDRLSGANGRAPEPNVFDAPDAIEKLGVGRNMVRAMRFWGLAFKVIEPFNTESLRLTGPMQATELGRRLLADDGWDPYLEDPASLWLLHWRMFTPPVVASTWTVILNLRLATSFNLAELSQAVIEQKKHLPSLQRYGDNSLHKDAACFIRMYAPPGRKTADDIECPFTRLGLLQAGETTARVQFYTGPKPSLPDWLFWAACCEYAAASSAGSQTIALERLVYGVNSPGVVFRVSASDATERLSQTLARMDGATFTEFQGYRQVQFFKPPALLAAAALATGYGSSHS